MGLFFPSDPIVHGQRAKGLPRYQELLERDWKSFLFADFVTLGLCIPYGLGVGYALLSSSLLVLIPVCVVGGLLVGPAISCMMDALFRSYRDAPRGWWENYCKGMKQNWKSSLLPGIVFCLALGIELFFGMVLTAFLVTVIGRMFGGHGTFADALLAQLATARQGMTAGEVAAHFGWSLEEARKALEQLFSTGALRKRSSRYRLKN